MKRYLITDCYENLVGNPAGYATMSAALSVANNRRTKCYKEIKISFDKSVESGDNNRNHNVVFRIEAI